MRLPKAINPFRNFVLFFQYLSHRVLRWTVTPFLMLFALLLNAIIVAQGSMGVYALLLVCQVAFYGSALLGWLFEKRQIKVKIFFIPYYFCMMNYAVIAGLNRYFAGKQSAAWEKAKRK